MHILMLTVSISFEQCVYTLSKLGVLNRKEKNQNSANGGGAEGGIKNRFLMVYLTDVVLGGQW